MIFFPRRTIEQCTPPGGCRGFRHSPTHSHIFFKSTNLYCYNHIIQKHNHVMTAPGGRVWASGRGQQLCAQGSKTILDYYRWKVLNTRLCPLPICYSQAWTQVCAFMPRHFWERCDRRKNRIFLSVFLSGKCCLKWQKMVLQLFWEVVCQVTIGRSFGPSTCHPQPSKINAKYFFRHSKQFLQKISKVAPNHKKNQFWATLGWIFFFIEISDFSTKRTHLPPWHNNL